MTPNALTSRERAAKIRVPGGAAIPIVVRRFT